AGYDADGLGRRRHDRGHARVRRCPAHRGDREQAHRPDLRLHPLEARSLTLLHRAIGPVATNVYVLGDERSREAIAIDTAIPSLAWIVDELAAREWTLKLIVSTHGHWDHVGDNAAVGEHTGAPIAVHPLDRDRLEHPDPLWAPFEIPPSVPAVELAEGDEVRFGEVRLRILHTPGHTEGSVCLLDADNGRLLSGDTLFAAGWGRVDLPGGDPEAMAGSLARLSELEDRLAVMPGHGAATTIGRERPWLELVKRAGRLIA
ncbi:MAG TPA: MBL fold metallo-hydrolase, partial [Candidatus Limnocylindrales bacterium]|nr:MBL fold metallo-hydrolase [Candidatus Limnocylindrales bacterium]